jgi:MFS transporter, DHA3 family, tetracycline resistance protein
MNLLKKKDPYQVYIYTCFLSQLFFTFIFTVNLLYHIQVVKLDSLQLVLVGTVLEVVVFLFEIPTGLVSDIKSRKLSVIIGYFLIGIGFLLEGLFPYFVTVLLCQVAWGIGYTFTSGSHQAWIADEIGEERASLTFVRGAKAGNLGKVIAIPLSILTVFL